MGFRVSSASYSSMRAGKLLAKLLHALQPAQRRLQRQAADAEIAGHHALAGDGLEDVQNLLALAEAIEENRHGAEVDGVRPQPHQVALDARQFGQQHANPLRPRRDFQVQQLFRGQAESQIVRKRREIIHAVGEGDALGVGLALEGFLEAGVQVADVVNGAHDGFALELQHQSQHAVRGGMLRAHAQDDLIFLARNFLQCYRHLAVTLRGIVLAQRVAFPLLRQHDAAKIGMAIKDNSK